MFKRHQGDQDALLALFAGDPASLDANHDGRKIEPLGLDGDRWFFVNILHADVVADGKAVGGAGWV
ncbi:MAG: hypothetical protein P8L78_08825 [Mariniblastus sp.]|nr:hypothetical protein [Mariniblastus sp.]MDG2181780.1 hypothetical protein [Mariniblastus sp.]